VNFFLHNSRFLSTNTNCLEKNAGIISDVAATILVKIMTLQQHLKKHNNSRERLLSFVSTLFFIKKHCVPRSEDIQHNGHLLKQLILFRQFSSEAKRIGHILRWNCRLQHVTEGKKEGRMENDEEDVSSYWMISG